MLGAGEGRSGRTRTEVVLNRRTGSAPIRGPQGSLARARPGGTMAAGMLQRLGILAFLPLLVLVGCTAAQPFVTPERLERGLVLVLTGIEGRSPLNEDMCRGLDAGGVNYAIELVDWTVRLPCAYLLNLRSEVRNRDKAEQIAQRVLRYQMAHPDRPVFLVGQSGGGAMAVWIAESMPAGHRVEGLVLLAASLSPDYLLDMALLNSRRGIVSYFSARDWVFLAAGTTVYGTMDGKHTSSAGRVGFTIPTLGAVPRLYRRLFQIPWHEEMAKSGYTGSHMSVTAREFVSRYVAPLLLSDRWDAAVIRDLLAGGALTRPTGSGGGE